MNIQPHIDHAANQAPPMLDHLMWSAVSAGFGLAVGVVLGIVIGVHLIGRRSYASSPAPTQAPAVHAVPVTAARVPALAAPEVVYVREYVREIPTSPAYAGVPTAPTMVQLDQHRPEVTR